MANLQKDFLRLPANVWVDEMGAARQNKRSLPRVKVQKDKSTRPNMSKLIPVSISDDPKILIKNYESELSSSEWKEIFDFIKDFKEILLDHWYGRLSTPELIRTLINNLLKK